VPWLPVDIIVIALGVNDVLQLHGPGRWQRDLTQLITALRDRVGSAPVVLASVPPMGHFPAFPQPLRCVLGWRAAALDRGSRRCAPTLVRVAHSQAHLDPAGGMFCTDRFHPSVRGYGRWGSQIAESVVSLLPDA
jgi:lysophospholipase L1-like esterase